MPDLFFRPTLELKPDLIAKLLRLGGYKQSDNGSTADYPEDWFEETPEDAEEWGEEQPVSAVPKFSPGEHVVFRGGQGAGTIIGEPEVSEGVYWYRVKDRFGPKTYQSFEEAMLRPAEYDQPGVTTIEDWFGIPPEGEDYYRTSMVKDIGQPNSESYGEWFKPVEPHVMEQAKYYHQCPTCNGYLEKRGDFYTCQQCPFEWPPGGERTSAWHFADGDDWDDILNVSNDLHQYKDMRMRPFIYSPSEKWIRWGRPGGGHWAIEISLQQKGEKLPSDAIYGRWFPEDDYVELYDYSLDDRERLKVEDLVRKFAPS
jgi:hypothetical protein